MFFKKSKNEITAMYFEGIDTFPTNTPCTLSIQDQTLVITKTATGTTVTLPFERIIMAEYFLYEQEFMLKYHNEAVKTGKSGDKYYIAIHYLDKEGNKKMLAFWEALGSKLQKLSEELPTREENIEL